MEKVRVGRVSSRTLLVILLCGLWITVVNFFLWSGSCSQDTQVDDVFPSSHADPVVASTRRDKNKDNDQPYFYFHVGPVKTATTTIQSALTKQSQLLVDEDQHYFIGKSPYSYYQPIMPNNETSLGAITSEINGYRSRYTQESIEKTLQDFRDRLDHHRRQGHSVIYSFEGFSQRLQEQPEVWERLVHLLEGWNVRVVVTYRHYFDWFRSFYFQSNFEYRSTRYEWDHPHFSFLEFLGKHMQYYYDHSSSSQNHTLPPGSDKDCWGEHLSLRARNRFSKHYSVDFFYFHQEGDMFENFICQAIPSAPNSCRALKARRAQQPPKSSRKHVSESYDAVRIAEAAWKRKLVHGGFNKTYTTSLVQKELDSRKPSEKYYECASPELEAQYLQASLAYEQEYLALQRDGSTEHIYYHEGRAMAEHIALFQKAKEKRKFCEIVPDRILKDQHWLDFFHSLEAKRQTKSNR